MQNRALHFLISQKLFVVKVSLMNMAVRLNVIRREL